MSVMSLTDAGMGGPDGPRPLTKTRGWSWLQETVCLGQGEELSLKSLTFSPSYV